MIINLGIGVIRAEYISNDIWLTMQAINNNWKTEQIKSTNLTPRKCRGHKIQPDLIDGKCPKCGGVR